MAGSKDFFLGVTQRLFSNWTALRMAVEHGMGSKERAVDFCPYMTEVFFMNENLSSDEIAVQLEDFMEEEFQTELQDNSATQVAAQLLRFYSYCIEGNEAVATSELEKLPALQPWILSREEIRKHGNKPGSTKNDNIDSNSDSDEESSDKMETTVDDDWTEVKTRKKK